MAWGRTPIAPCASPIVLVDRSRQSEDCTVIPSPHHMARASQPRERSQPAAMARSAIETSYRAWRLMHFADRQMTCERTNGDNPANFKDTPRRKPILPEIGSGCVDRPVTIFVLLILPCQQKFGKIDKRSSVAASPLNAAHPAGIAPCSYSTPSPRSRASLGPLPTRLRLRPPAPSR